MTSAAMGCSRAVSQTDDEQVLAKAQDPVRYRFRAGVGDRASARLGEMTARGYRAAKQRNQTFDRRRRIAQRGHRDERRQEGRIAV